MAERTRSMSLALVIDGVPVAVTGSAAINAVSRSVVALESEPAARTVFTWSISAAGVRASGMRLLSWRQRC